MRLADLEISGFRAFGAIPQKAIFTSDLAVFCGSNSHGKTSLVEALEFLFTGTTTRSELHGGAKSEFVDCLRNVHLPEGTGVYVQATLKQDNGKSVLVRRDLIEDLDGKGGCLSTLTVDGVEAESVASTGYTLSDPPFRIPVLMQHSIRYVLAAKPQSRADYLKAVLDITDLSDLRDHIVDLQGEFAASEPTSVARLRRCAASFEQSPIAGIGSRSSESEIRVALVETVQTCLGKPTDSELDLAELTQELRGSLVQKRSEAFPDTDFRVAAIPSFAALSFPDLRGATELTPQVASGTAAISELFDAVLRLPVATTEAPATCPVCETQDALTPERIGEISKFLADSRQYRGAVSSADRELQVAVRAVGAVLDALKRSPVPYNWNEEQQEKAASLAVAVCGEDGSAAFETLLVAIGGLRPAWESTRELAKSVSEVATDLREQWKREHSADPAALEVATEKLAVGLDSLRAETDKYREVSAEALATLTAAAEEKTDTRGWADLADLVEERADLAEELRAEAVHARFKKEFDAALKQIDSARAKVFDEKFSNLSEYVVRWWNQIRPEEPIRFSGLKRRGTGQRYIDLKAVLGVSHEEPGVTRDAAGVFSDSQLNALGIAAFLARSVREGRGFIVLDDPVPASDEEHRATFVSNVLSELLDAEGIQVIVTTHDKRLNRQIRDLHSYRATNAFRLWLDSPGEGTLLEEMSDDLQQLISDVDAAARYAPTAYLAQTSNDVRKVWERFCKELIIKAKRGTGEVVSIEDYDGKNLGDLEPMVRPLLNLDKSHPGKVKYAAKVLNPGSHDDPRVPAKNDLKVIVGYLRDLKKRYLPKVASGS